MTRKDFIKSIKQFATDQGFKIKKVEIERRINKPITSDIYYYIDSTGKVTLAEWKGLNCDEMRWEFNNAFSMKEDAEEYAVEANLFNKLNKFAAEVNGNWIPNWEDKNEDKWFCFRSFMGLRAEVERHVYPVFGVTYFKSEELAERAIKEIILPILINKKMNNK